MDVDDYSVAFDGMIAMEAQETLNQTLISSWSNLKQSDREKMHKKLYMQAYPDSFNEQKQVSLADALRGLNG
jgi:hypothetical protein